MQWSPEMLRHILETELPDGDLIVVSNREPYVHERVRGRIQLQVPASGLVSALEPITRTCAGTWIAHGSGSADMDMVDANDRIAVPPSSPAYTLRRVWLTEEEYKGYYSGFANEGLWPLCHIAFTRPIFRAADWECYQAVNRKFAEVVLQEAKTERPVILVQDYHFALLPRLIRESCPRRSSSPSGIFLGQTRRYSASARGASRSSTACSAARSSASTSSSTATISRQRGPLPGIAHRPRGFLRLLRRQGDPRASLSDLDRVAGRAPAARRAARASASSSNSACLPT